MNNMILKTGRNTVDTYLFYLKITLILPFLNPEYLYLLVLYYDSLTVFDLMLRYILLLLACLLSSV